MPRHLRIQYPGAIYHVLSRGDRRKAIFRSDVDRELFLATLAEVCGKTDWQIHVYCLMSNHFHFVVETPLPNLVVGMKWMLGVYTKRFNIRHKECGHLFAGRYKALMVDGSGNGYLRTVCDYVHLNPVRARLLKAENLIESFRWSSYGDYLKPGSQRPPWLRVDRLLGEKRIPTDSVAGRREFARGMEERRTERLRAEFKAVERGWCLGSEEFREELLAAATERIGATHYGAERRETETFKAQRLVKEEMQRMKWKESELPKVTKGDKRKVAIAARLRRETTMTLKWIADRLAMGSWTNVSNLLRAKRMKATAGFKK
ncbi:MAG: transposase [Pedosphaera sp.]|nr:transposase [Pedosphaera sp.]